MLKFQIELLAPILVKILTSREMAISIRVPCLVDYSVYIERLDEVQVDKLSVVDWVRVVLFDDYLILFVVQLWRSASHACALGSWLDILIGGRCCWCNLFLLVGVLQIFWLFTDFLWRRCYSKIKDNIVLPSFILGGTGLPSLTLALRGLRCLTACACHFFNPDVSCWIGVMIDD